MIAAAIMLLAFLGSREIWTQEHRWADIVSGMFFRHDFLHPYLNEVDYYDKPLLSYWLMAGISFVTGELSTWALRLPSAFAGMLAVWSIYRLGTQLKDKQLGLLAGWILITTFYFLFWAKTSSADMLNMAGSLFAVAWYFEKKSTPSFFNYVVFFLILAVTSLCKGLVGIIVPLIAIFPDLVMGGTWKKHLRVSTFLAIIPAAIVYSLPFWASSHWGGNTYGESGLYLVYRENILRYFQPFDHKGPIYTYFVFLPVYLLPWALFFIPALFTLKSRWKNLSSNSKWLVWAVFLLFVFFTLSGSRRNYYVLPLVPFAILMTADWILSTANEFSKRNLWAGRMAVVSFVTMFVAFDVVQPLYYAQGGTSQFAIDLKNQVTKVKPWQDWQVVMLDPESKTRFYLRLSPFVKNHNVSGKTRSEQTEASLLQAWPMLKDHNPNTIFISRKMYAPLLRNLLPGYDVVEARATLGEQILKIDNQNAPVAFIPKSA
jgi:4-amino-4-deoxy-L-arabinose transferase-like glycosyltransferase